MSKKDNNKQKTCYAIDACSQDQIIDIFEETFGYLSFVDKFTTRIRTSPIDYDNDRFASSTKPLIVLDIDNTILFVRYFGDEICVDDAITYYHNGMDEVSGIVLSVWYRLSLKLSDDDLIDEFGTDLIEYDHCHTLPHRLKKRKSFAFPYRIDSETNEVLDARDTVIKDLKVIGCEIEYEVENEATDLFFRKFVSFEEDSIEIENFQPSLHRESFKDAAFVYDGFVVRIRDGVEDFLEALNESWDVVFFTAANRSIYEGLMQQLHSHLSGIMGRDEEDPLWKHIYFREDCTYDFDERGKIYHHKDLTKYNRDLSKVVIVDNSPLAFKSLEPNAILIKDFFGKDTIDNELDTVLELTDQIMDIELEHEDDDSVYVDYRYITTGIVTESDDIPPDLSTFDRRNPEDILESTQRFLLDLKEHLMENGKLPTSLKFGEPKHQSALSYSVQSSLDPYDIADNNSEEGSVTRTERESSAGTATGTGMDVDDEEESQTLTRESLRSLLVLSGSTPKIPGGPGGGVGGSQQLQLGYSFNSIKTLNLVSSLTKEASDVDNASSVGHRSEYTPTSIQTFDESKEAPIYPLESTKFRRNPSTTSNLTVPLRTHSRTKSYEISVNLKDVANLQMSMSMSMSKDSIDAIRKNNGNNRDDDDDSESSESDNAGLGSKAEDTDSTDNESMDGTASDWDDIDSENENENETKQSMDVLQAQSQPQHLNKMSMSMSITPSPSLTPNPSHLGMKMDKSSRRRRVTRVRTKKYLNSVNAEHLPRAKDLIKKHNDAYTDKAIDPGLADMSRLMVNTKTMKRYSMKPRPDESSASITRGQSTMFLKMNHRKEITPQLRKRKSNIVKVVDLMHEGCRKVGHAIGRRRKKRDHHKKFTTSRQRNNDLSTMHRLEMQRTPKRRRLQEPQFVDLNGYYPTYTQFVIYDDHFENNTIPISWD